MNDRQPFLKVMNVDDDGRPSAPPMNGRVIEPFQIATAVEINSVSSWDHDSENNLIREDDPTFIGRQQSAYLDHQLSRSQIDGERIVDRERNAAMISNITGANVSYNIVRKVEDANRNSHVNFKVSATEFGDDPNLAQKYQYPKPIESNKKQEGYVMSEYKSVYEANPSASGYKIQEYKSIYDK